MIKVITTLILALVLFVPGNIIPAIKKLINVFTSCLFKLLSIFGLKIHKYEHHVKVSDEFKATYKGIRTVKLSKKNIKQVSYIDWPWFAALSVACVLFLINFLTSGCISNWLFSITDGLIFIKSANDMNTIFTAALFSTMSFSLSRLLIRWKETKQQRVEHKQLKIKKKALSYMSSKELLDNAKKKDQEKYDELMR